MKGISDILALLPDEETKQLHAEILPGNKGMLAVLLMSRSPHKEKYEAGIEHIVLSLV